MDVPIQSDPVSPPPITITFLFLAEIKSPNSLKPSTYSLFNFKKSIACTTPFRSEPFIGSVRLAAAPPHNKITSKSDFKESTEISTPIFVFVLNNIPSSLRIEIRLSIIFFSNLKSGIPYLSNPPIFESFSKTVTECPARLSC